MLWCNFTWLGFMQTIVGDYSKSKKTHSHQNMPLCVKYWSKTHLIRRRQNIRYSIYLYNDSVDQSFIPIQLTLSMHQTFLTLSELHLSLESSPLNLQKDCKLWSDRDKKIPNHEYCEAKSYSSCFNIYVQHLILVFWPPKFLSCYFLSNSILVFSFGFVFQS